jgi:hypothetical protein
MPLVVRLSIEELVGQLETRSLTQVILDATAAAIDLYDMPDYDKTKINDLIAIGLDKTRVTKERGDALEKLFCYLLCELPGIVVRRNTRDPMRSKETDITVANAHEGLPRRRERPEDIQASTQGPRCQR